MEEIGLGGRRVQMINISSAMGGQFAWSAAEFSEEIRRLGPNPLKNEKERGATNDRATEIVQRSE